MSLFLFMVIYDIYHFKFLDDQVILIHLKISFYGNFTDSKI
jgi:hypothetical protein